MNILVIGGTHFVGRVMVEAALGRGHRITLFHRGETGAGLFDGVDRVIGNRDGDIERLNGEWDVVLDMCGYVPRIVKQSVEHLAPRVSRYVFVSTIAVYADLATPGAVETSELASTDSPADEAITGQSYGPLKALCERVVSERSDQSLIVRPGLIVGRYDSTDRFSYYPHRVRRGGVMAGPGGAARPTQFIDVRDLADWTLDSIEAGRSGVYNAIREPMPIGDLLATCARVCNVDLDVRWVDDAVLTEHQVRPMVGLPFWLPPTDVRATGVYEIDNQAAVAAGMRFRSAEDTVRDTLAWLDSLPEDHAWRAGLSEDQERRLLEAVSQ